MKHVKLLILFLFALLITGCIEIEPDEAVIRRIEVLNWPESEAFVVGDNIDLTAAGVEVRVTFSDNETEILGINDVTLEGNGVIYNPSLNRYFLDMSAPGDYTVIVRYDTASLTIEYTLDEGEPIRIEPWFMYTSDVIEYYSDTEETITSDIPAQTKVSSDSPYLSIVPDASIMLGADLFPSWVDQGLVYRIYDLNDQSWCDDCSASIDDGMFTASEDGLYEVYVKAESKGLINNDYLDPEKEELGVYWSFFVVAVYQPATSVTIDHDDFDLLIGEQVSLDHTVMPENASNQLVYWWTEDTSVATIDNQGNLEAVNEGTTRVHVVTDDGALTDSITITVEREPLPVAPESMEFDIVWGHDGTPTNEVGYSVSPSNQGSVIVDPEFEGTWLDTYSAGGVTQPIKDFGVEYTITSGAGHILSHDYEGLNKGVVVGRAYGTITIQVASIIPELKDSFQYEFELNVVTSSEFFTFNDGVITGYFGTQMDLVIPSMIKGQEVTEIGHLAFNSGGQVGDNLFRPGMKLTSVVLPEGLLEIGYGAFNANALTSIHIPDSVTHIHEMAFDQNAIKTLVLGPNVVHIGNGAFAGIPNDHENGNNIEVLELPDALAYLGSYAFAGNMISEIVIPSGITVLNENVFSHNMLTSLVFEGDVTLIDLNAFAENELTEVTFPASLLEIGMNAFNGNPVIHYTFNSDVLTNHGPNPYRGTLGDFGVTFFTQISESERVTTIDQGEYAYEEDLWTKN